MKRISPLRCRWLPAPCHLCTRDTVEPHGLCPACWREWQALLGRPRCPGCGAANDHEADGRLRCGRCLRQPRGFDAAVAAVDLEPPVRHLVHRLKYHHDFSVLTLLRDTLTQAVLADVDAGGPVPEAIVPMPQHPAQHGRRGFNQARLLADGPGRALDRPVLPGAARRLRDTGSLTALSATERKRVLRDAFEAGDPLPERVAIVDDVLTTGASSEALTRALRHAGVAHVTVWALARTP